MQWLNKVRENVGENESKILFQKINFTSGQEARDARETT